MEKYRGQHLPRRIVLMFVAVLLMGVGISFCVRASMGQDPCSTMNLGISSKLNLSFGVWQAILNCIMFVFVLIFDRSLIGLGTLANMLIIGFVADLLKPLWAGLIPGEMSFWLRVVFTLIGTLLLLVGCSVYMTANLGMAPYDCVAFLIINIPTKRKLKFQYIRIAQDALAVLIGFACGAAVGLGTVIMVFLSGPLIPFFNRHIAAPLLGIKDISSLRTEG